MKQLLILFLLVLCSACVGPHLTKDSTLKAQIEKDRSATVMLVDQDPLTGQLDPYCSGVWINTDYILTAYHCVRSEDESVPKGSEVGVTVFIGYQADIQQIPGHEDVIKEAHPGLVYKISPKQDLAIIKVNKVDHAHGSAAISDAPIEDGDDVLVIGHPLGLTYVWLPGTVEKTMYSNSPSGYVMKVLYITSSAYFGNSGGGAFDADGRLVGICSFLMRGPQMTFFVHRDEIVKFLASE